MASGRALSAAGRTLGSARGTCCGCSSAVGSGGSLRDLAPQGPAPAACKCSETSLGGFWQTEGGVRNWDSVLVVPRQSQVEQSQPGPQRVSGSADVLRSSYETRENKPRSLSPNFGCLLDVLWQPPLLVFSGLV